jgi:4a-hydroxytetrahydrobiopterin dehydratase
MGDLANKQCVPCRTATAALSPSETTSLLGRLRGWEVIDNHHLRKSWKFPDFQSALEFVNRVGELAEREDHHPDICFSWGKARVELWTHKVNGLTENDFVMAAKIDEVAGRQVPQAG